MYFMIHLVLFLCCTQSQSLASNFAFLAVSTTLQEILNPDAILPYRNAIQFDFEVKLFVGHVRSSRERGRKHTLNNMTVQLLMSDTQLRSADKNLRIWRYMVTRLQQKALSASWLMRCSADAMVHFENLKIELNMHNPEVPYYFVLSRSEYSDSPGDGTVQELNSPVCEILSRAAAARVAVNVLPCTRSLLQQRDSTHYSGCEFSECLQRGGLHPMAIPDASNKFVQLTGEAVSTVSNSMILSAAVIHPIKSITVMNTILDRITNVKASMFNNVPMYWCDGGRPRRQVHMTTLLTGLSNVHRVVGPSTRDIADFQRRVLHGNMSEWCTFNWQRQVLSSDSAAESILRGELGCTLSHLKAIRAAYHNGDPFALIMEDDISFETLKYWKTDLESLISELPAQWDHLMLTVHSSRQSYTFLRLRWGRAGRPPFLPTLDIPKARAVLHSTGAYVISRQGMAKLLRRFPVEGEVTPCWRMLVDNRRCTDLTSDNCLLSDVEGSAIGASWNRYFATPVLLVDSRLGSSSSIVSNRTRVIVKYHNVSYNMAMEWISSI